MYPRCKLADADVRTFVMYNIHPTQTNTNQSHIIWLNCPLICSSRLSYNVTILAPRPNMEYFLPEQENMPLIYLNYYYVFYILNKFLHL